MFAIHARRPGLIMSAAACLVAGGTVATAEPTTFDFSDPKGVNGIVFIADSPLEPFVGMAGGLTGTVTFDPAAPAETTGALTVPVADMSVPNPTMTDHMRGEEWLGFADDAEITVHLDAVTGSETHDDGSIALSVDGRVALGSFEVTKSMTVHATHLPDAASERGGGKTGDLLVLRADFTIDRTELGIKPDMGGRKVAQSIRVIAPVTGYVAAGADE